MATSAERRFEAERLLDLLGPPAVILDTLGSRAAEFVRSVDPDRITDRDLGRLRTLGQEFLSL